MQAFVYNTFLKNPAACTKGNYYTDLCVTIASALLFDALHFQKFYLCRIWKNGIFSQTSKSTSVMGK